MTWAAMYIDETGQGLCEKYEDWAEARDTLHGFIDMVNPKNTDLAFHRLLDEARPEHAFHAADGVYQFAIETI